MVHNNVHATLLAMTEERGWDEDSQIFHLTSFLQELADDDPAVMEQWHDYLDDAAEEEDRQAEDAEQYARSLEEEN